MITKTITYEDYNGVQRTEKFYFNLTKAEVMEMEMAEVGGMAEMIKKIVEAQDAPAIIKVFKDLILKAYGEKSADGKHFMKLDSDGRPLSNSFAQTEAYSQLFMELATDTDAAADFVNGILPVDPETAKKAIAEAKETVNL